MALGDDFMGVAALHRIHAIEREVIDDQDVDGEELAQLGFVGVIEPGVLEGFEHLVGAHGQHRVSVTTGDVAERVREEGFADAAARRVGLRCEPSRPRPTIHALRHTFAVRALEACPDDRDRITQHMVALSTYLGHGHVAHTYWYLEATPQLMRDISERSERFVMGGQP